MSFCDPDAHAARGRARAARRRAARVLRDDTRCCTSRGTTEKEHADAAPAPHLRRPRPHATSATARSTGCSRPASGSACCAPTASRSRTSSSCARPRTRRRPTTIRPPKWARRWPAEWIWKARRALTATIDEACSTRDGRRVLRRAEHRDARPARRDDAGRASTSGATPRVRAARLVRRSGELDQRRERSRRPGGCGATPTRRRAAPRSSLARLADRPACATPTPPATRTGTRTASSGRGDAGPASPSATDRAVRERTAHRPATGIAVAGASRVGRRADRPTGRPTRGATCGRPRCAGVRTTTGPRRGRGNGAPRRGTRPSLASVGAIGHADGAPATPVSTAPPTAARTWSVDRLPASGSQQSMRSGSRSDGEPVPRRLMSVAPGRRPHRRSKTTPGGLAVPGGAGSRPRRGAGT